MERNSLSIGQVRPEIRAHEYAAAMSYLTSSTSNEIVVLHGETGSGKSVLLSRLAHDASRLGFVVMSPSVFVRQQQHTGIDSRADTWDRRRPLIIVDDAERFSRDEQLELLNRIIRCESVTGASMILTASEPTEFDRAATIIDLAPLTHDHINDLLNSFRASVSTTAMDQGIDITSGNLALLVQWLSELKNAPIVGDRLFPLSCGRLPSRYAFLVQSFVELDSARQSTLLQAALSDLIPEPFASPSLEILSVAAPGIYNVFVSRSPIGTVGFRSSIHRAAVLLGASTAQHLDAHRRLAGHSNLHPVATALHAAAAGVDEPGLLAWAAKRLAESHQLVWSVAASFLLIGRAPQSEKSVLQRRMLELAWSFGDIQFVSEICTAIDHDNPYLEKPCITQAFTQAMMNGEIVRARALVEAELRRPGQTPLEINEALVMLAFVCLLKENDDWWQSWRDHAEGTGQLEPAAQSLLREIGLAIGETTTEHAVEEWARPSTITLLFAAITAIVKASRATQGAPDVGPLLSAARDSGIAGAVAKTYLAEVLIQKNEWAAALQAAQTARTAASEKGLRILGLRARSTGALASALLGDLQTARSEAHLALADPLARQMPIAAKAAEHAMAICFLSGGDAIEAMAVLSEQLASGGGVIRSAYEASPLDLIDAEILLGRLPDPGEWINEVTRQNQNISPRGEFVLRCGEALLHPNEQILAAFIQESRGTLFVFERARVRLMYGERLRAQRLIPEAKLHLHAAAAEFEYLGARRWRERAIQALRPIAADAAISGSGATFSELTEQEERIAALAAAGLSNKEIGARLYLSPRTVGGHLYNVFPKLGIKSRAALRDALATISLSDEFNSRAAS